MRAVAFTRYGDADSLQLTELPDPEPQPGEVRIRVVAGTVSPADVLFRSGRLAPAITGSAPWYGGLELAGTVDHAGQTSGLSRGDRVIAYVSFIPTGRGCHAERVVADARAVAPLPRRVDLVEAATLPTGALTAQLALETLALPEGAVLGVTGAAGVVGGYALELARLSRLRPVAIASPADEALVRRLGAEWFVPRGHRLASAVRDVAGAPLDGAIDAGLAGNTLVAAVRDGGAIVVLRDPPPASERGIGIERLSVAGYASRDRLGRIGKLAAAGALTPRVAATFAARDAPAAHRLLERGGVRGRPVLLF